MSWYYTVARNQGGAPTPIWVPPHPKYDAQFTNSQNGPMGPSFKEIPEIDSEAIIRTWKICLLMKYNFRPFGIKSAEQSFKLIFI